MKMAGVCMKQHYFCLCFDHFVILITLSRFGGSVGHDSHILYTLSALQILALLDRLELIQDREQMARYVANLQQPDGSFAGDKWGTLSEYILFSMRHVLYTRNTQDLLHSIGEIDTRFSYCALSTLALLGYLPSSGNSENVCPINLQLAVSFVSRCRNFDGGFGAVPGAESHAGQIFCCVGALSIAGALDEIDRDLLGWWLSERQCDSGGLNGRPEKQADVCYSWWILSCLRIMGRVSSARVNLTMYFFIHHKHLQVSWIDKAKLANFILQCQGIESYCIPCLDLCGGGIADRPGNMVDIFHTFFGISGLSLLGYFSEENWNPEGESYELPLIDPTYALPKYIVERMGLPAQTLDEV